MPPTPSPAGTDSLAGSPEETTRPESRAIIGIDLGTSNSVVATWEDRTPVIVPLRGGHRMLPSVVALTGEGKRLVGFPAKRQAVVNARQTAYAMKRLIGRPFSSHEIARERAHLPYEIVAGPDDEVMIALGGEHHPVPLVCSWILEEARRAAEDHLGHEVRQAVITVPAFFNDGQRQATIDAARLAGIEVLRIINEPTAAALAYGLARRPGGYVVVVDLGGGTLDVTVLSITRSGFTVQATGGDTSLGGEDFDKRVIELLLRELPEERQRTLRHDPTAMQRLREAAEQAKCELSQRPLAEINLPFLAQTKEGPFNLNRVISRAELESITADLVERVVSVSRAVLDDAHLQPDAKLEVLLVGGMGRMPRIREACRELFGREPSQHIHPEEAIALGAAVQAHDLLAGTGGRLLTDVAPHSLGIEVSGGLMRAIIPRNSPLPARARHRFHPARDGQTEARIVVLQGESPWADENAPLGEFTLGPLRGGPRAQSKIEVQLDVSENGILEVTAAELITGIRHSITVQAARSVTRSEAWLDASRVAADTAQVRNDVLALINRLDKQLPEVNRKIAGTRAGPQLVVRAERVLARARDALNLGDLVELRSVHTSLERTFQLFDEVSAPRRAAR